MIKSTIFQNIRQKNQRFKIEAATKIYNFLTIYCYKSDKHKNIGISTLFFWKFDCFGMKHVFPQFKMTALQTYNKNIGLKTYSSGLRYFNFADTPSQ